LERRQRKQKRKFKQEGRRLVRREADRKREEEMYESTTLQEQLNCRAEKLGEALGYREEDLECI